MFTELVLYVGLSILAFYDVKIRKLPWMIIAGMGICGLLDQWMEHVVGWDMFGGVALGGLVLVISILSQGRIGRGDGYLLCATGALLGLRDNLLLLTIALAGCGGCAFALLITKKGNGKTEIPFVPFLLIADLFLLW